MKKVLFITTSPTENGCGDQLIAAAMAAAQQAGAEVSRINLRDLSVAPCKACNACKVSGQCAQKDDFADILAKMKENDSIVVSSPIYFNLPCAQAITLLNRCFVMFGPPSEDHNQAAKAPKKLGVILTCGGSDPEQMKATASMATMFFMGSAPEQKIEVFGKAAENLSNPEYQEKAAEFGAWAAK